MESEEGARFIADGIAEVCGRLGLRWIFKASFDKANRTSQGSFRGPGLDEGLESLARIGRQVGVPLTTDVHLPAQAAACADAVDLLQVPAFLSRQSDLLEACGSTGRPVNVKKGQFSAPGDMAAVLGKLPAGRVMLTERGACFGYNTLVVDYRSLPTLRGFGVPVCFDATHSVQAPGGGATSGGDRRWVPTLARAAAAVGIDALFAEVHDRPEDALSDGPNMVRLSDLEALLAGVLAVRGA
ncbi:MAG: 3-deoxy-8-phosphooctulonate synthase [Myxococcales bacterium]|nr:3-deoxy-8-phosphooctulonate synthase [Myxococcales bacterium]